MRKAICYMTRNRLLNHRMQLMSNGKPFTGEKRDIWTRNKTIILPMNKYDCGLVPCLLGKDFDGWYWELDHDGLINILVNDQHIAFEYSYWSQSESKIALPTLAINLYLFKINGQQDQARKQHVKGRMRKFFNEMRRKYQRTVIVKHR